MPRFLCSLVMALLTLGELGAAVVTSDDTAQALIQKALVRVALNEEQHFESRLRSWATLELRRFNGEGEVEESDQGNYEVFPIEGTPYGRRLTINESPLNEEELEREAEREAQFREELRRIREGKNESEENENQIVFNQELVERYVFTLAREETWRNRPSHRISFKPRDGDLPVRRDIDRAPVLDNIWWEIQSETYTDIRVLFRRTRVAELRQWHRFELVEE